MMTEEHARGVLARYLARVGVPEMSPERFVRYRCRLAKEGKIDLTDQFSADELESIAWWMRKLDGGGAGTSSASPPEDSGAA